MQLIRYAAFFCLRTFTMAMMNSTTMQHTSTIWPATLGPPRTAAFSAVAAEAAAPARPKLWAKAGADKHADEGDGGIAGALAGQRHLAQRTAASQRGAEAHGIQAQDVPQVLGVGDGLAIEAELEAAGWPS